MRAWELLSDHSKWTQGAFARRSDGQGVDLIDPKATSWCALGAIWRCYSSYKSASEAEVRLEQRLTQAIGTWNDSSDYATVHALLKELDI